MSDSGDLSDGLDEFEASGEEQRKTKAQNVSNKPYDEAYEISADLSMAESFDGREAKVRTFQTVPSVACIPANFIPKDEKS
jgi:hypothetical protein